MLKKLFENSSMIYSELVRVNHDNNEEIYLASCSEQMSNFIHVQLAEGQMIPISEIEFYSNNKQVNWLEIFEQVLRTKEEISFEYDCVAMNKYLQVKVFTSEKEHLIALFNDITDQIEVATFSETLEELYKSNEMFQSIFQQAPFGIAIVDLSNDKSYNVNQRYCEITGRNKEELLSVDWKDITHPDDIEIDIEYTRNIMKGDFSKRSIEKRYLKPDGSYVWVELSIVPIYNVDKIVTHHIVMINDITDRKKLTQRNEYLSYHDELTGLYNRHFYEAELKRLDSARNLPLTVIFADVNGLKMTNDALGHGAGDLLLKNVGYIIKKVCRKSEIVARVGGDEFIILLPNTSLSQAEVIIERLNETFEKTSLHNIILSVSFGIAVKNKIEESIDDKIVHAEQEMYKSKLLVSQGIKTSIFNNMLDSLYDIGEDEQWHSIVIGELVELMGRKLGFTEDKIYDLKIFGIVHDIGKVGIKESVMKSHDILNIDEREEIKRHAEIGYQIVSAVNEYSSLADSILAHHERWDGQGYPNGLKGKLIPQYARILSIVDAYEVITGKHGYKKEMLSREEAILELKKQSGKQFDPELVEMFSELIMDYDDPRNK